MPTKATLKNAALILALIGVVAYVQRNVMPVPVVGAYLPGGSNS